MKFKNIFFCPCAFGLEAALAEELHEISIATALEFFQGHKIVSGGIILSGSIEAIYAINLYSRIANRVLLQINNSIYNNEHDIYNLSLEVAWEDFFSVSSSFLVKLNAQQSHLKSLKFATLRIKDAICDRFRRQTGKPEARPNVDTVNPDIRIYAYLNKQEFILYLDTSGEALFKRGWRTMTGEAPLKETLAAGILRLSGWQPKQPLLDPMCGSGTFLIEAAQIVLEIPPGGNRVFAFEKMHFFQPEFWRRLKEQSYAKHRENLAKNFIDNAAMNLSIYGSDISSEMLSITKNNWQAAGLDPDWLCLKQIDVCNLKNPNAVHKIREFSIKNEACAKSERQNSTQVKKEEESSFDKDATLVQNCPNEGIMIVNPPYGSRILPLGRDWSKIQSNIEDEQYVAFAQDFAKTLKQEFSGWQIYILSSDLKFSKKMRLKEAKRTPLFNGPIECRLFHFPMVQGNYRN